MNKIAKWQVGERQNGRSGLPLGDIQKYCDKWLFQSEIQPNVKKNTEGFHKQTKVGLLTINPFSFSCLKISIRFVSALGTLCISKYS